jgi:PST family polysaccharide transporter
VSARQDGDRRRPDPGLVAGEVAVAVDPLPDATSAPEEAPPRSRLGRTAARGAAVTLGGQGIRMLVQMASVVVLAKLLTPTDYGLVGMVLAIAGIADIFRDFGLSTAAVQAKTLSRAQRDNLFWSNSALGGGLCLIVIAGAGPLAAFYGEPRVAEIAQVLSLTFLVNGIGTQYRADLNRRLRFGPLAATDIAAQVAGLTVGVLMALGGAGYWALVGQQLTQAGTSLLLLAAVARWLPGRPTRNADMTGLLRFGRHMVGMQIVGYFNNNIDSVVIGRRFGAAPLGLYNRGYQLLMSPLTQLRGPTTTVALPVLSRLESDTPTYGRFLVRGQVGLGYTLVVGLSVVAAGAEPIVQLFLGDRWVSVTPILRILAFAGAVSTLSYVAYWVFLSRNLTRQLLRFTLAAFVLKVACVLIGSEWGVVGVAAGFALAPAISAPVSLWWLARMTPIPLGELLLGYTRILVLAVVATGAGWGTLALLPALPAVLALGLVVLVVLAVYLLAAVLGPVREDLRQMAAIVRLAAKR